jgi:hypothetical protein
MIRFDFRHSLSLIMKRCQTVCYIPYGLDSMLCINKNFIFWLTHLKQLLCRINSERRNPRTFRSLPYIPNIQASVHRFITKKNKKKCISLSKMQFQIFSTLDQLLALLDTKHRFSIGSFSPL